MGSLDGQSGRLNTVDDLIRKLADEESQDAPPILAFPTPGHIRSNEKYEFFRAKDLDRLAEGVAAVYVQSQLQPVWRDRKEVGVIAILGKSTLEYFASLLGLCRLGYAVLLLSPRLATEAAVSLLDCTKCSTLVYMREYEAVAERIQKHRTLKVIQTPERDVFDTGLTTGIDWRSGQDTGAADRTAFIMHSSGSTGMPKPIFQTHRSCLENFENGNNLRSFLTAPFYHTFGFATVFRTISKGGILYMYDHNLPLASNHLLEALDNVRPESFFGVPYALKLLAETQDGIDALARCGSVNVAGSSCPDELGDRLVSNGVHLIVAFGATECGQVATSRRSKDDTSWNYLRFYPNVKPYVYMKPTADQLSELVILDGLRSKVVSNSHDPPNSFHSRDLFTPHPEIPDAWKYVGRMDDRITLVNGEKVLPLPIEGRIRDDPLVTEAVVFGIQRDFPGLLVFKNPQAKNMTDGDFLDHIWPAVEDANSRAEGFSQISKQSIIVIGSGIPYPQTDKGTIIRAKIYMAFEKGINDMYERVQQATCGVETPDLPNLQNELLVICSEDLSLDIEKVDDDLFNAGMDSLKAARLSNTIRKRFYIESEEKRKGLGADTIYRNATISRLARYIKNCEDVDDPTDLELMRELIQKYSTFSSAPLASLPRSPSRPESSIVLLTGVTGSLGCHVLKTLLDSVSTKKVICIVRVGNTGNNVDSKVARDRILESLRQREIDIGPDELSKITAIPGDLGHANFGETLHKHKEVLQSVTTIIHAAWPVDFNWTLESFIPQLSSLQELVNLSLEVCQAPARMLFCSSISTALSTPAPATIPESLIGQMQYAQSTGYAQSKLCAEYILNNAAMEAGADTIVARIGQIVADTKAHIWNSNEAIPLMVRSVNAIQILPDQKEEQCRWLPVDECAQTICEFLQTSSVTESDTTRGAQFFNVLSPRTFSWTDDFLPALRQAGFTFDISPVSEWLAQLEKSDPDPQINPSMKLLGFWKRRWASGTNRVEQNIHFDTLEAQLHSDTLAHCSSPLSSGHLLRVAERWHREWNAASS
ncbi:hypothetical protein N7478_000158 [Penicillium angulare]|uniref:uncharacterized protein n=1 Tax=Penicillium angulare TaxID=116970 RepID=UPI0025417101|nr:uncharacterized protein N7478_000158 [Penicillium angulare]KAJ5290907.1 hypothetical protein N7478_000158 [Penicillium angulare]